MWFFTSVEFPSDNQELWRAHPPTVALGLLEAPPPTSMPMEDIVLETLTHTPPIVEAATEEVAEEVEVEVVDDFEEEAFADAIDDSIRPPPPEIPVPLESMVAPKMSASVAYLTALKDVAVSFGATAVFAETLDSVLGHEPMCVDDETGVDLVAKGLAAKSANGFGPVDEIVRVAAAWQSAFRGDEPDFSVCSQMLDEWSANLVAKLLGRKELFDAIRRELRSRGIAAFGLLEAA